jgi:predicted GIY-YIG superfamily endonuclease
MSFGPQWDEMDSQSRYSMTALSREQLPITAGVYALYREGERQYVGKAACLRDRVWGNHSGRGASMTNSAMRRNIAEHLGIATAADIKARRHQPTEAEAQRVRTWLDGCEIAWRTCPDEAAAVALETAMKREARPPLTRR